MHRAASQTMAPRGRFLRFDHVKFWVGNAKQAASYYVTRLGFQPFAYRGLETGSRKHACHAVRHNQVVFVFVSSYEPGDTEIGGHLVQHGDGVKDVAFTVDDLDFIVATAKERGAKLVRDIFEETDEHGTVRMATVQTYGDTTHTFVDRSSYAGLFLPGYGKPRLTDCQANNSHPVSIDSIDHIVGNQPDNEMTSAAEFYEKALLFHRFWSVDDSLIRTEFSALRSVVVANFEETIKLGITEPAPGIKKSQIQEYVDYYGGAGVQHVALRTSNIVSAVRSLKARGLKFLHAPTSYYDSLRSRLSKSKVRVREDINVLQELNILVDFDEEGYLLQIFTEIMQDRPTFYLEVIERHNFEGFGVGNFKSLFESYEQGQSKRGNL